MKITLELSGIDYGALAEKFLPAVRNKLAEKEGTGAAILAKFTEMPPSAAAAMINMLPQETKDDIAVILVNKNKEKIVEKITGYAEKNGLYFRIDDFNVE